MHIFIDESGDCGMRRKTSADYFAVAAVILPHPGDYSQRVKKASEKFVPLWAWGSRGRHRREFLAPMNRCGFAYAACYLDKTKASTRNGATRSSSTGEFWDPWLASVGRC